MAKKQSHKTLAGIVDAVSGQTEEQRDASRKSHWHGANDPLDDSREKKKCKPCKGTGKVHDPQMPCTYCGGTGEVEKKGRNAERQVDKTHLSIDIAETRGLIHRDYLAHCHRWSHVVRHLQRSQTYVHANVYDIGCGKEFPLAKLMYVNKMSPRRYLGIDVNKLEMPDQIARATNHEWFHFMEKTDVTLLSRSEFDRDYPRASVVVSFEMLEHVVPSKARQTLEFIHHVMDENGVAFISTPCFNGKAAGNHINEMTYTALGALLEDLGFVIEAHYGTFASIHDYVDALIADSSGGDGDLGYAVDDLKEAGVTTIYDAFVALREYYDTNVLATIFAPLYPQFSRNVLWRLRKPEGLGLSGPDAALQRKFQSLASVEGPWSSSASWRDLAGPKSRKPSSQKVVATGKKGGKK